LSLYIERGVLNKKLEWWEGVLRDGERQPLEVEVLGG
jgi:hypothetical protein